MKNKIFFFSFLAIWALLIILNFIMPKVEFSEQENRVLAKIPTFSTDRLLDGTYAEGFDEYFNDHFVFRNEWVKLKTLTEIANLRDEINNVYIGKDGYLFEKFTYGEKEKENINLISSNINKFVKSIDKPVYFMLIPNSIYINEDKLPENVVKYNQADIIEYMYSKLDNIKTVNSVDILKKNKDKYIYFKTDHHMTSLGSYFAYSEFCKIANISPVDISTMERKEVSNSFLGTFDSKVNSIFINPDIIEIYENKYNKEKIKAKYDDITTDSIYNYDYLSKKDKYSFFLNGNNARTIIQTKADNDKKLLVIKDSYAHIMAQFLCNNYSEIHFIDPRYYKASMSEYIKENEIDEVLFLYNVSNIVSDLGLRTLK